MTQYFQPATDDTIEEVKARYVAAGWGVDETVFSLNDLMLSLKQNALKNNLFSSQTNKDDLSPEPKKTAQPVAEIGHRTAGKRLWQCTINPFDFSAVHDNITMRNHLELPTLRRVNDIRVINLHLFCLFDAAKIQK